MPYHHEQIGRLFIVSMLIGVAIALAVGFPLASNPKGAPGSVALIFFIGALIALLMVAFARLGIDVGTDPGGHARLRWAMTFGWPGATIPLSAIARARIIPVTFWMGIGIHFTLSGWVWNVALGRGVQIRKRDGGDVVLGTDDPEGLLAAISDARAAAGPP
ncbi:MAG TPA: hypothetical protein VGF86_01775 [Candidatus Tumulicola sp.]|jgi:hypothetical protein